MEETFRKIYFYSYSLILYERRTYLRTSFGSMNHTFYRFRGHKDWWIKQPNSEWNLFCGAKEAMPSTRNQWKLIETNNNNNYWLESMKPIFRYKFRKKKRFNFNLQQNDRWFLLSLKWNVKIIQYSQLLIKIQTMIIMNYVNINFEQYNSITIHNEIPFSKWQWENVIYTRYRKIYRKRTSVKLRLIINTFQTISLVYDK